MGAYLTLCFDGAACLGDRFSGAGQGEKFSAVRARVGDSENAVRGLVAGGRVVAGAAGTTIYFVTRQTPTMVPVSGTF